jgi:hypothetical protein
MAFKKGKSGNPAGKPKGAEARTTKEAKELFISIMNGEVDNIKDSFDKIRKKDPAKYLDVLAKLFPYFMPKQMEINATGKIITVNPPDKRTNID